MLIPTDGARQRHITSNCYVEPGAELRLALVCAACVYLCIVVNLSDPNTLLANARRDKHSAPTV
jgi:hypothetical protein